MRGVKDVEAYLGRLNRRFKAVDGEPGTFLIHTDEQFPTIALRVDSPLVVIRVHIGDVPKAGESGEAGKPDQNLLELYRKLLSFNAKSLVHSSYGIDDNRIILSAALELENLDFNEVEAALDEIDIALAQQVPVLAELSKKHVVSTASR